MGEGADLNHDADLAQQSGKIGTGISKKIHTNESDKDQSVDRVSTTGEVGGSRSADICTELPVLRLRREKRNRYRSLKRERCKEVKPTTTLSEDSDDNQMVHQTRLLKDAFAEDQAKTKRRASEAGTLSDDIDDSMLPLLAARNMIPSPQKLLRGIHIRKTWNGTLKPHRNSGRFQSHHDTFQRRVSSSDATLTAFEATETILMAEIDADERCANFLCQRAPRETLASHPDVDDSSHSQIHYKLRALDRKIQMNREKLAQVRERIAQLGGKPSCLAALSSPHEPEENDLVTKKSSCCAVSPDAKKPPTTRSASRMATDPALDAAAKKIQTLLRRRALKIFMQDLKLGNLEKVFDTGFGAWYYYNARTDRSFWESVHHVRLTACNSAIYHRQQAETSSFN